MRHISFEKIYDYYLGDEVVDVFRYQNVGQLLM